MNEKKKEAQVPHYYGDSVRRHMLFAGIALVILMPLDKSFLALYLSIGIVFVLFSFILAGLTSPNSSSIIIADTIISLVIFCIFEFLAIASYIQGETIWNLVFLLRQAIALLSLGSLYLGIKTLRGMYYRHTL
ncbi:MAG: hypothetical protein WC761_06610 [Candidatus Paceibacterota bacterium]|jgi:hypothetical protein